jgi:hypothetical protein
VANAREFARTELAPQASVAGFRRVVQAALNKNDDGQ